MHNSLDLYNKDMLESLRSPQLRHGPNFPMQVPQDFGGNY